MRPRIIKLSNFHSKSGKNNSSKSILSARNTKPPFSCSIFISLKTTPSGVFLSVSIKWSEWCPKFISQLPNNLSLKSLHARKKWKSNQFKSKTLSNSKKVNPKSLPKWMHTQINSPKSAACRSTSRITAPAVKLPILLSNNKNNSLANPSINWICYEHFCKKLKWIQKHMKTTLSSFSIIKSLKSRTKSTNFTITKWKPPNSKLTQPSSKSLKSSNNTRQFMTALLIPFNKSNNFNSNSQLKSTMKRPCQSSLLTSKTTKKYGNFIKRSKPISNK